MPNISQACRNIIELYLKRSLRPEEVVFYINGKRGDNRIENLIVFEDAAARRSYCRFSATRKVRHYNPRSGKSSVEVVTLDKRNALSGIVLDGRRFEKQRLERLNHFREKMKQELCGA